MKKKHLTHSQNILESLREVGETTIAPFTGEIKNQIFNFPTRNFSGDILPGENLEMKEVVTGKRKVHEDEQKQGLQINVLQREEKLLVQKRMGELRLELSAIHDEIAKLAKATNDLEQEVQIAALQVSADPSNYELFFLKHILEFIKSFRVKAESARSWLSQQNRRASKRNVWGQNYQKMKGKYLLSQEHYLSRSAA